MSEQRYIAKQQEVAGDMFWGVFDTQMHSWPAVLNGQRIPYMSQDEDYVRRVTKALNEGKMAPVR